MEPDTTRYSTGTDSSAEFDSAQRAASQRHDVVILGGGLAALTLSLQLKRRMPEIDILVIERRRHPVAEAAHKVGESSVEIQAHYLSEVLGLRDYLEARHLKKFGFRFFFSDRAEDISKVTELGASHVLPTKSYQLDRGILENDLAAMAKELGVQYRDASMVRDFSLGRRGVAHRVSYQSGDDSVDIEADWLIDASGRAGLVKRRLDLAESNAHDCNAVWFRIGERIDVDDWSDDPAWLARCTPPNRWLSTNHLVGEGYWVWLIPLASGSHSVGIVADPVLHPLESINSFDKAMAWLQVHQPQLYRDLDGKRDKLQDFAFFKRFSYGCKQVFSGPDRWALTGEAGLFLDPFYSPGGDFIAMANTFITELIATDRAGRSVAVLATLYQRIFLLFYESMLPLYVGQYQLFGDPEVLPMKVLWDYTFYWGVMCQLFFQSRLTDVTAMSRLQNDLSAAQRLNVAMQRFLRAWSELSRRENPARMLDQASLPWFAELNRGLTDKIADEAAFRQRLDACLQQLSALAQQLMTQATRLHPGLDSAELRGLLAEQPADDTATLLFA